MNASTQDLIHRLSKRLGITPDATVERAIAELEENLNRLERNPDASDKLKQFWRDHPLPPPTGLKADKAFHDWLSGEEDVDDAVR